MNFPVFDLKLLSVKTAHGVGVYLFYTCNRQAQFPLTNPSCCDPLGTYIAGA